MKGFNPNAQYGIGLVEIMVSIAIGLFILAGVLQLYATSSSNASLVDGSSRIQENARYVMARLEKDIKQAGYAGCFNIKSAYSTQYFSESENDFIETEPRFDSLADDDGFGEVNYFGQFIDGVNDESQGGLNFDKLTLRYFSAEHRQAVLGISVLRDSPPITTITLADVSDFEEGQIAAVGDCSRITIFTVLGEPNAGTGTLQFADEPGRDYQVARSVAGDGTVIEGSVAYAYGGDAGVVQYNVGTSQAGEDAGGNCSSGAPQYCALFRNGEELVEGVEQFDIEFGWKDTNDNLYFNAATEMNDVRWFFTDRVRVSATFNSVERTPTNDGTERLTRRYTRTFLIQNQLPGDASSIAAAQ